MCGKESLSSLCKVRATADEATGEEGVDDRRTASKGEKGGFHIVCSCNMSNRSNCERGILGNKSDVTFIGGPKITRQAAALRLRS